jgi:hypothetical protein
MTHVAFKHIEPFRRVLAVLLLALATACAHAGDNPPPPRFDGLYVSSDAAPLHTSYMRFFPDGSVAMVSVSGPSTPQQVAAWLSPSHPFSAHGSYQVQVDRLSGQRHDLVSRPHTRRRYPARQRIDGRRVDRDLSLRGSQRRRLATAHTPARSLRETRVPRTVIARGSSR